MQSALRGTVGVLGFGVDGRGVVDFLGGVDAVERVIVFDDAPGGEWKVESGKWKVGESLDGVDLLFRSPGFPLTHPLVIQAKKKNMPITSSTTYCLEHFAGKTIGVTGSCGKTTCTALIAAMLRAEFGEENVEEGGNDRRPRLDLLSCRAERSRSVAPLSSFGYAQDDKHVIFELSSFQLIDTPAAPTVAVVLNLSPNHLDWHADMEEYAAAKKRIVSNQKRGDIAILNQNDPIVKTFANDAESEVRWFEDNPHCNILCKTHPDTIRAAVTAARALGVSEENIVKILGSFPGVPHRLEFIREIDGVKFYNDSSCTTPESAVTACEVFPEGSVILLMGGRDKGMDFSNLYEVIQERNVRVVAYGEMSDTFVKALPKELQVENLQPKNFAETIKNALTAAKEGDNIVLSPACASFDMFKSAKERGKIFAEVVGGF